MTDPQDDRSVAGRRGRLEDMPDLPERPRYFRASEHYTAYFKEAHAGGALDAKTKELVHLALVLALHCEP